ncbi:Bug family tripartite tricarboxylate transporter substrate binding protein [Variovorax sp. DAIF25]|uniref:Bug family tripartite tricarboxylate transporter substrate binding protein n=1 Tax=Variovorax sp. DAIF25 TaxID=3080983 RepID=UPI003D6B7302
MNLVQLARATLAAFGFAAIAASAGAQGFPDKPIRIVVPYPPGGSADSIARQLGVQLTNSLKQQVIVDNKPGGNSVIAAQSVANAAGDGYTLLISDPTALAINPSLFRKLPYDPVKDFEPVGLVARFTFVLLVNSASPIRSVKDFVEAARARPGKMNYGSAGTGTPVQLATEIFKDLTHVDLTHVPYKGAAPAVNDLMANQIDAMFTDLASGFPFIQSGKVRALVITNAQRVPALPDVPTLAESGYPGFKLGGWYGISAPKKTPAAVIATLNTAIRNAVASQPLNGWISGQNFEPAATTPAEFAEIVRRDGQQWGDTVRRLDIRID